MTILGPSGSGKTTLLTLIAGLAAPSAGRIDIGGRDVTHLPAAKRNVGLVFQSYALFPHMTVADNVAFPLSVRGLGKARRGAQGGRCAAARAARRASSGAGRASSRAASSSAWRSPAPFVFEPEILLLDEPLGALDRKLREQLQVELRQLQRSLGITTILVTHDQEEALSLSDRIVVLDQGRVQQIATPEEAYLRPANRFVADFLGTANLFEGVLQRNGGGWCLRLDDGAALACGEPRRRGRAGPRRRSCGRSASCSSRRTARGSPPRSATWSTSASRCAITSTLRADGGRDLDRPRRALSRRARPSA